MEDILRLLRLARGQPFECLICYNTFPETRDEFFVSKNCQAVYCGKCFARPFNCALSNCHVLNADGSTRFYTTRERGLPDGPDTSQMTPCTKSYNVTHALADELAAIIAGFILNILEPRDRQLFNASIGQLRRPCGSTLSSAFVQQNMIISDDMTVFQFRVLVEILFHTQLLDVELPRVTPDGFDDLYQSFKRSVDTRPDVINVLPDITFPLIKDGSNMGRFRGKIGNTYRCPQTTGVMWPTVSTRLGLFKVWEWEKRRLYTGLNSEGDFFDNRLLLAYRVGRDAKPTLQCFFKEYLDRVDRTIWSTGGKLIIREAFLKGVNSIESSERKAHVLSIYALHPQSLFSDAEIDKARRKWFNIVPYTAREEASDAYVQQWNANPLLAPNCPEHLTLNGKGLGSRPNIISLSDDDWALADAARRYWGWKIASDKRRTKNRKRKADEEAAAIAREEESAAAIAIVAPGIVAPAAVRSIRRRLTNDVHGFLRRHGAAFHDSVRSSWSSMVGWLDGQRRFG
jgi:hypothetical protein